MARIKRGRRYVTEKVKKLPGWAKGALAGGALVAATRPVVTHVSRGLFLRKWGPHLGLSAAAPALGFAIAKRRERGPLKKEASNIAGMAALGLGGFFGERALLHSMPAVVPRKYLGKWAGLHKHKIAWALAHGLPLAILAASGAMAGKALLSRRHDPEARKVKKLALMGFGTQIGLETAKHFLPKRRLIKLGGARLARGFSLGTRAISLGAIPAYSAYLVLRQHRVKRRSKHGSV